MDLLLCSRPLGLLEPAPRTSLRADSAQEKWDGFWCLADERYYTRCTRDDGSEEWFGISDQVAPGVLPFRRTSSAAAVRRTPVKYVAQIPRAATRGVTLDARRTVIRVGRVGRRSMLVGVVR